MLAPRQTARGEMSGGQTLARCVAGRLSLRHICREDLIAVVDSHGEHAKKVRASLDRATRAYEQFSQLRRPYIVFMRRALLGLIRSGDVVYGGYASHLLVPSAPACLRVRINAGPALRIRNAVERLGVSEEEARERVFAEDEERVRWGRFMYGRDIRDPNLYDVCFAIDRISCETICEMIAAAVAQKEFERTPQMQAALDGLYLAATVEAALVGDPRTLSWEISARSEEGRIRLEGPFLEDRQLADVLDVARGVGQDRDVEYQPGYASSFAMAP